MSNNQYIIVLQGGSEVHGWFLNLACKACQALALQFSGGSNGKQYSVEVCPDEGTFSTHFLQPSMGFVSAKSIPFSESEKSQQNYH